MLLFAALIISVGVVLASWDYRQIRAASLLQADAFFARGAGAIERELRDESAFAETDLRILRTVEIVINREAWAQLPFGPPMAAILDTNPDLVSIYVGYPDGRFILYRPLRTPTERELYAAPRSARYLVERIDAHGAAESFIALDRGGHVITRVPHPNTRFDPRVRPWFREARSGSAVITPVYRFATTGRFGYSEVLQALNGAVVGADFDLAQLSERLQRVLPTPGSTAAIVDPGGVTVAATDGAAFGRAAERASDGRPRIADVAPVLAAALQQQTKEVRDAGGATWRVFVEPFGRNVEGPRQLVVAVPDAELFAGTARVLRETVLAAAILFVLWLPVIWWAGNLIAQPLQKIRGEAESLFALDFTAHEHHDSIIVEIDRLANAFASVKRRVARFLALGEQLASERDLKRILNSTLGEMVEVSEAAGGAIALLEDGRSAEHAVVGDAVAPAAWAPGGLAQRAIESAVPLDGEADEEGTEGLALPLLARAGGAWGAAVLVRGRGESRPFSQGSRSYATAVAGSAAIAIEAQTAVASLERYGAAATRFVPGDFVRLLGYDDIRALTLGDHVERRMNVMFLHLRGVDAALSQAGPGEALAIIGTFFACAGPAVRAHGGFVDKYVGNTAMALFPDDADAAVEAALEIIGSMNAACRDWSARFEVPFSLGAGVHNGRLMLGTIGEEQRYETTVIADVVNAASRISGLTAQIGVPLLVSGAVGSDLNLTQRRRLGDCAVKGALHPIALEEIYAADEPSLIRAKGASAERFDRARRLLAAGDALGAGELYRQILAEEPRDRPAAFLLDVCARGLDAGWNGVIAFAHK